MKLYDAFSLPAAASGLFGEIFNFSCSRHFAFSLSVPLSLLFFFLDSEHSSHWRNFLN